MITQQSVGWAAEVDGPEAGGGFGDEDTGIGYSVYWTHAEHPEYRTTTVYGVCVRESDAGEDRYYVAEMSIYEHAKKGEDWDYADGDSLIYGDGSLFDYETVEEATGKAERMARHEASLAELDVVNWTPWDEPV